MSRRSGMIFFPWCKVMSNCIYTMAKDHRSRSMGSSIVDFYVIDYLPAKWAMGFPKDLSVST